MSEPRVISGYEAMETLRRADRRGKRSVDVAFLVMVWGAIMSFLGVRR
jgi:hypothetical protein